MKPNSCHLGDCLEVMTKIPDHKIDMILCDLPYGTTACHWDTVIPFEPLWAQYRRIIKPGAAIVLTASQPFASALVMSNPKWFKYEWIWNKNNSAGFALAKKRPFQICEHVLVFGNKSVIYFPIMEVRGRPRDKSGHSTSEVYSHLKPAKYVVKSNNYYPKNLLTFSKARQYDKTNPTQKPVALFEYLVKTYTNPGDVVLDNCAGSGTTGIACINTGRKYILIEQDPGYFETMQTRVEQHRLGHPEQKVQVGKKPPAWWEQ